MTHAIDSGRPNSNLYQNLFKFTRIPLKMEYEIVWLGIRIIINSNKIIQQENKMRASSYANRQRQSSSVMNGNRRYMKKGVSPDISAYISPCVKSNQQLISQITPHLQSQHLRPTEKNRNNATSTSKLGARQDMLFNYDLLGLSDSKHYIGEHRRKGKQSYYKKAVDTNNSEMFFNEPKSSATQLVKKMNSQQQTSSLDQTDCEAEQMHYRMVEFQQKCKKMVAN